MDGALRFRRVQSPLVRSRGGGKKDVFVDNQCLTTWGPIQADAAGIGYDRDAGVQVADEIMGSRSGTIMRVFATILRIGWAMATMVGPGLASDDFPIAGSYVQNRPCHGDGTDPKRLLVTISADQVTYRDGTCMLTDKRREENKISVRATCTNRSGTILSGEVTFTIRQDNNLEMVDSENTYATLLFRCP
jgi:hypothetical protein